MFKAIFVVVLVALISRIFAVDNLRLEEETIHELNPAADVIARYSSPDFWQTSNDARASIAEGLLTSTPKSPSCPTNSMTGPFIVNTMYSGGCDGTVTAMQFIRQGVCHNQNSFCWNKGKRAPCVDSYMFQWDHAKASPAYVLYSGPNCVKKISSYTQSRSNCTGGPSSFEWSYQQCTPTDVHGFVNAFYLPGTPSSVVSDTSKAYMYTLSVQRNFGKCVTNSTSGVSYTMGCNGYNGWTYSFWYNNPLSEIHAGCTGTPTHTQAANFPAPVSNPKDPKKDIVKSICV